MDVKISNHGTIGTVAPITKATRTWVEENLVLEGWQWFANICFAVEPRYLDDLIAGMQADGLEVGS